MFRQSDACSVTPLHIAAYFGLIEEMRACLNNGSFINNQMDYQKLTPLHLTLLNSRYCNQCTCFEQLVLNNAKYDISDANGLTVKQIIR